MAYSFFRHALLVVVLITGSGTVQAELSSIFAPWQQLLSAHLQEKTVGDNGLVTAFDYPAALEAENTQVLLQDQRDRLAEFDIAGLDGKAQSTAFWINAYNFFMVDQILTRQPDGELVDSVWDYGGRYNPFTDNVFQRKLFNVGGTRYSLDGIEKGILLGDDYAGRGWKDARVHFAVNCASVGCPPLRKVVYTSENLEPLLAENTRRAFSTDRHLRVEGDILYVTELFKWYQKDFAEAAGSRKAFIRDWVGTPLADAVADTSTIEFIDYDWALNKPANFPEFR
jgi:hypothetical protein